MDGPALPLTPLTLPITASSPQPRATTSALPCLGPLARPASSPEPWVSASAALFLNALLSITARPHPACPPALALGPPPQPVPGNELSTEWSLWSSRVELLIASISGLTLFGDGICEEIS